MSLKKGKVLKFNILINLYW